MSYIHTRNWRKNNPVALAIQQRDHRIRVNKDPIRHEAQLKRLKHWWRKRRLRLLKMYGGKCACCGESHFQFLQVHHIDGGGGQHRREMQVNVVITWLLKKKRKGFGVLCANCHQAIDKYGFCPHKEVSTMVNADRQDWMSIEGIGAGIADKVVKAIHGEGI